MKIFVYTCLALLAFAGNSILSRLALGDGAIDAASFTVIRLLSGIIFLALALKLMRVKKTTGSAGSWRASITLFVYAITFSYAYLSLETGAGALILFGAVQITMILWTVFSGYKLHLFEWLGVLLAFAGFIYLLLPGLHAPALAGFILMAISGIAWGAYTLMGKGTAQALRDTTGNFMRTAPFACVLLILTIQYAELSQQGIVLAIASGALASGLGYTLWYLALGGLSGTQASVVQLLVPALAAAGGAVFANELITPRLWVSSLLILGGIAAVVLGKHLSNRNALAVLQRDET